MIPIIITENTLAQMAYAQMLVSSTPFFITPSFK